MNDIHTAADGGSAARIERLITAIETQTNTLRRLIGLLEPKRRQSNATEPRQRRTPTDRPIEVSPLVQAAVKRALARVHR